MLLELRVLSAALSARLDRLELLSIAILLECFLHEDIKSHSGVRIISHKLGRTGLILGCQLFLTLQVEVSDLGFSVFGRAWRPLGSLADLLRLEVLRAVQVGQCIVDRPLFVVRCDTS